MAGIGFGYYHTVGHEYLNGSAGLDSKERRVLQFGIPDRERQVDRKLEVKLIELHMRSFQVELWAVQGFLDCNPLGMLSDRAVGSSGAALVVELDVSGMMCENNHFLFLIT